HGPRHLPRDAVAQHLQVGPVGLAVRVAHGRLGQPQLLGGSLDEGGLAGPALLGELAVGGGGVGGGRQVAGAAALLVVGPAGPVPVELAEDEDRRDDQERHGAVLERAAVAVPHQVVDQSLGLLGGPLILDGLLAHRGHPRRPHDVGIGRAVLDELDRHVAAKPRLLPTVLLASHGCLPVRAGRPGRRAPFAGARRRYRRPPRRPRLPRWRVGPRGTRGGGGPGRRRVRVGPERRGTGTPQRPRGAATRAAGLPSWRTLAG